MANHFRLYGRPLMADEVLPPLTITGSLPFFVPGEPYEGRLQINNSIGRCTVEVIEAGLPPGYSVRVDNVTKEVVVKWDAYEEVEDEISTVPNGDFEHGDNKQWTLGNGWSIKSGGAETGTFSGVFENFQGTSSIESVRVPYTPGTPIRAQCRFQQGASSKGNLVGRIILLWCDADGKMLPGGEGTSFSGGTLINSGSNGEWKTSEVTGASREAATVAVGFSAHRKKQNKLARVDNFTWNYKYTLGTDKREDYFLSIKVTDSANRVAYWSGEVLYESFYMTSSPYGYALSDALSIAGAITAFRHFDPYVPFPDADESLSITGEITAFKHYDLKQQVGEALAITGEITAFKHYDLTQRAGEALAITGEITAFKHYDLSTYPTEGLSIVGTITEFTHE